MKALLTTTTLLLFALLCKAQISEIAKGNWKINTSRESSGFSILRSEGDNTRISVTNISYTMPSLLINEIETQAEKQMWTQEKKTATIELLQQQAKGGRLEVYIARPTIEAANARHFTVIVQDGDKKELYREEQKDTVPQTPRYANGPWWNLFYTYLPENAGDFFYVYVIDDITSKRYVFKVTKS